MQPPDEAGAAPHFAGRHRLRSAGWRTRMLRLFSLRWQRRLIFFVGGGLIGVAGAVMAVGATRTEIVFSAAIARFPLIPLILTPLGFALIAWITRRFVPNSEGSGIPQAIAARALPDQARRATLVSLRIGLGKIIPTLGGRLCGASSGRGGPTVQVGASIMFAAGVAAAFNTPLAGVIFGIEEIARSFDARANGLILGAVIAAGFVAIGMLGNYTYFGVTTSDLGGLLGWLAVPACGLAGGLAGGIFSRLLILVAGLPGPAGRWKARHPILFALVCGLLVAICGLLSGATIFGTGYRHVKAVIDAGAALPYSFGPLKMVATTLSSIAGIPGGLFSPSLAVGAGFGYDIARLMPVAPIDAIVLLGMVGYFSGVVQAPITAFAIVTEMTADHAMILPLMATSMIASATSRLICPEGVYHVLAHGYLRRAGHAPPAGH